MPPLQLVIGTVAALRLYYEHSGPMAPLHRTCALRRCHWCSRRHQCEQRRRTLPVPIPRARHGGQLMDLLELPSNAATTRQVLSTPHYVQRQGSLDSLVNHAAFLHEARSILIFRMLVQMTIGNPALSWASSVTVLPPSIISTNTRCSWRSQ